MQPVVVIKPRKALRAILFVVMFRYFCVIAGVHIIAGEKMRKVRFPRLHGCTAEPE